MVEVTKYELYQYCGGFKDTHECVGTFSSLEEAINYHKNARPYNDLLNYPKQGEDYIRTVVDVIDEPKILYNAKDYHKEIEEYTRPKYKGNANAEFLARTLESLQQAIDPLPPKLSEVFSNLSLSLDGLVEEEE